MQATFAAKRVGTLNKFFTKISVGEVLENQFDCTVPSNVLDLGKGEGSLSMSVVRRWPNVGVVTGYSRPRQIYLCHFALKSRADGLF